MYLSIYLFIYTIHIDIQYGKQFDEYTLSLANQIWIRINLQIQRKTLEIASFKSNILPSPSKARAFPMNCISCLACLGKTSHGVSRKRPPFKKSQWNPIHELYISMTSLESHGNPWNVFVVPPMESQTSPLDSD